MEYPTIERDNIDFSSDSTICNIGYHEGILKDGRPYRLEVWSANRIDNATIFISNLGLEDKSDIDLVKYIAGEEIIDIDDDRATVNLYEDINGNSFHSINLILNDKDEEINKLLVPLENYDL